MHPLRSTRRLPLAPQPLRRTTLALAGVLVLGVLTLAPAEPGIAGLPQVSRAAAQEAVLLAAPSGVEAAIGDRAVGLEWEHAPERAGYRIFRSTTLPVPTTGTPVNSALVTAQTYIDTNRTNGTTYHYVVVTEDATGRRSAPSATVSARPSAPAAPTGDPITWTPRAAAAIGRAEAGGAAVGGKLYVFGGQYDGITQTLRSDRYDLATNTWTRIRDLPELVTHAPVVADGSTLWIIGGYVGSVKKDSTTHVWKYDTLTDTYRAGPPLPAPRGAGGAVLVGRTLHYFAGAVRQESTGAPIVDRPQHWVLDIDTGTSWTESTPVPNPRNHLAAVLLGRTVYLIGGQHDDHEAATPQVQVDAYDVATATYRRVADLPVPRGHITESSYVKDGKLLVLGGSVLREAASATIYEYDPAMNRWTTRTNLPEAVRSPVSELIGDRLVVSGGRTSVGPSTSTWAGAVATQSDTVAPAPPTGLTAVPATGPSVQLAWNAGTETDLAGYSVYRSSTTPVPTTGTPLSGTAPLTTARFTDSTVRSGTYHYTVVARDTSGNASAAAAPTAVTVPSAPADGGSAVWSQETALPDSLLDAGGAAIGTKIYVVAGKTSAGPRTTLRIFDTLSRTWSTGPPLPGAGVENPAVTVWGGRLYAAGGSTGPFSGAVARAARYDPVTNAWTSLPPMPVARGGAAAVAVDGVVWVLGGMGGDGASLATTARFDVATSSWSAGPTMTVARDHPGAATVGGRLYVFGGRTRLASGTETAPTLRTVEALDPAGGSWTSRAPMPTGRRSMAVGVLGERILVAGGERRPDGTVFSQTEGYDPASDTWQGLAPMTTPRHGTAAAVVDGRLHVIGGGTTGGSSYSGVHEVLSPGATGDTSPPRAPSGVVATAGSGSGPTVEVRWTAGAETDLAGYRVHRSASSPVATTGTPVSGAAPLAAPAFTDASVTAGTTYRYVVQAVDTSGNVSAASAEAWATVTAPPAGSPTLLAADVDFSSSATAPPTGYVRDVGEAYGPRAGAFQGSGLSFGWVQVGSATPVDLTKNGRTRTGTTETDVRRSTFVHMQYAGSTTNGTATPGSWEMAVPEGSYAVTVAVGDAAAYFDSSHTVNVEGQNAVAAFTATSATAPALRVREAPVRVVRVTDGRLTLSPVGGANTKLAYVTVRAAEQQGAPRLAAVRPANTTSGVLEDASVTAELSLTTGGGIDVSTLDETNVTLRRVSDDTRLDAVVNTSGGGDVIVLTPAQKLTAGATYRFSTTSAVKDVSGAAFEPWSSVFTVGTASAGTGIAGVAFDKLATTAAGQDFTSVVVGPDRKLYAATLQGSIFRYPVLAGGDLGPGQRLDSLVAALGARTVIGLAFDPSSTASDLRLYVTANVPYVGTDDVPDWTGRIVRLRGPSLEVVEDVVVGLPRSVRDHETNSLAFGPDGALYVTQGSNTAMGAPDAAWGFRPERALSAAVLRLDLGRLPTALPLDVRTEEGGSYDPYAAGAALTVHASGVRNAYDLVWHRNGSLYVPTNGSAAGGNVPASPSRLPSSCAVRPDGPYAGPSAPGISANPQAETDVVSRVQRGGYYGHPTPARCEWVLNGGNPTSSADPFEVSSYPVGTAPDRNYRIDDVFDVGLHASPNGVIEYRSATFGGALAGRLLVVRYSAGKDVLVLSPDSTGRITQKVSGVTGMTGFDSPLDLAEDTASGTLYVTELGARRITRLRPRV